MAQRSAQATRLRISEAAARLFAESGYSGTSVRDIAQAAQVDPALVMRHSGSKESLFLETMRVSVDDWPLFEVPLTELGRRMLEVVLDLDNGTRAIYLALVHGATEPAIADRLRHSHDELFVRPLRERLSGPDADLRARLAASMVGGLLHALWVVGDETLLATDPHTLIEHYGMLLQQLLTPPKV